MISVLILTKNEQQDIPGCLASLKWCDDIHLLDSFSTDETIEIARSFGAKITQHKFEGYSSQRNIGLKQIAYKYPWLFILDADERIPETLPAKLFEAIAKADPSTVAFRLRRKDYLFNKWIKHAQITPFYIRLVKPSNVRYEREINEVLIPDGKVEELDFSFDHYPFSKGIKHWIDKHNVYSTMEAERWIAEQNGVAKFSVRKALFDKDFSTKRFHQKGLFYKVPFRPMIKWGYVYIWRRAFMDGYAGLVYATLQSIYEYFIVIKSKEILSRNK